MNLQRLFNLYDETPRSDLKFEKFVSRRVQIGHDADSQFELLRRQDVLVHHPYDCYDSVVHFLQTAAHDPRVLSIRGAKRGKPPELTETLELEVQDSANATI